jgi:hypothetical protein
LLVCCLSACSGAEGFEESPDESLGEGENPLYGPITYNIDCDENPTGNGTLRDYQEWAMEMGRTAAASNAFTECMDRAVRANISWSRA